MAFWHEYLPLQPLHPGFPHPYSPRQNPEFGYGRVEIDESKRIADLEARIAELEKRLAGTSK